MKRWLLLAAIAVAVPIIALACGGDDSAAPTTPTSTTTATTSSPTSTATAPLDAGGDAAAHRTGCLDRPTDIERPDRLPCHLIPPGLTL